jgi:putative transposase
MRKSRFSGEQIIGIVKEHDAGAKAEDLCRRHGISGTTFYKWKGKFGGMEACDAKRLRALEDENRRLKKLLAEQMLDNAALKELVGKHFLTPRTRHAAVRHVVEHHGLSQRRATGLRGSIGRLCAIGASAETTRSIANCFAHWQPNGVGSAIGVCARWRAERASQ